MAARGLTPSGGGRHVETRGKYGPDPGRAGNPDGQVHAALLDPRGQARTDRGAGRRPGSRQIARRITGGVPRSGWKAGADRRVLSASRRLAGVRAQRGGRPALPLSWLEDGLQRLGAGIPARAAGAHLRQKVGAHLLSGSRSRRLAVDLYGTGGARTTISELQR